MQMVYLMIGILICAFCIFAALRNVKKENQGQLALDSGIREGLKVVGISAILMAFMLYIYLDLINPSVIENYREFLTTDISKSSLDEKAKQAQIDNIHALNSPYQIVKTFLPRVILSGATFVIVSMVLLRKLRF